MSTVAIIGTGPPPDADHEGYSMGYRHADSYRATEGVELVACADVVEEHAAAFVAAYDLDPQAGYTDHVRMLDETEPDIVSVCTPPATHFELVADCARHNAVGAVHCEKPMAVTFGRSRRMVELCEAEGIQLTINVQNRCSELAHRVKELVTDGTIGELERIEVARHDLLQTGIHHIDLANYVAGDTAVEWVLGQIDYPEESVWYTDMHTESQSLGLWRYATGVHGLATTGNGQAAVGTATNRFIGTEGRIELSLAAHEARIRTPDAGWETIETGDTSPQNRAVRFVAEGLDGPTEPIHSGAVGLAATEIVFSIWESARRRGRVDLPLEISDNPLQGMVESDALPPGS